VKSYVYKPEDHKDDDGNQIAPFKGSIEVEMMMYRERLDLAKSFGVLDEKEALQKTDIMIGLVEKRVKKVDLKFGETQISDLGELGYYEEGAAVINDIGCLLMRGIPLGNP